MTTEGIESVHVVLVGDQGVGKTSLILGAAQKPVRGDTPIPTLPPTKVHAQWLSSEAHCICHDTDSEQLEETRAILRRSDVALICFGMDRPASLKSAVSKWLPFVLAANKQMPVLFIGCKRDISKTEDSDIAVRPCLVLGFHSVHGLVAFHVTGSLASPL
jgi:GTPase SAR1 family protein